MSKRNILRENPQDPSPHWPSAWLPRPPLEACPVRCSGRTCGSPCSQWFYDLCNHKLVYLVQITVIMVLPSILQFLHTSGGLSGHWEAGWPSWLQTRQVPLKTRGLVHSALLWLQPISATENHPVVKLLTLPHRSWSRPYPCGAQGSYVRNDHRFHSCTCISICKRES